MYSVVVCLTGISLFAADITDQSNTLPKVSGSNLVDRTNASIRWYRDVQVSSQWISQPSELYYWNTEHDLSTKILQATFTSISAQVPFVEVLAKTPSKNVTSITDS